MVECKVNTPSGELCVHCWEGSTTCNLTVVTVHPWASLGGGEHNCIGIAKKLKSNGLRTLTFELKTSSMVWGVFSGHGSEVEQVIAVCNWASERYGGKILLLGSSAGAPMAGSALDQVDCAIALAVVGYTFGWLSSVAFGSHFSYLLRSTKPKLFIMGEADEFTAVSQLEAMVAKAAGTENKMVIVPGVGHFHLESPAFDGRVSDLVVSWLQEVNLITVTR